MHDPNVGRFIQRDPIGFAAGTLNLYIYAEDRPTTFTDPLGRQARSAAVNPLSNWEKARTSADFTVRKGNCCYRLTLNFEYQWRYVEQNNATYWQWKDVKYISFRLGEKVPCAGKEIGELDDNGRWRQWKPPFAPSGEKPHEIDAFAQAPEAGTSAPDSFAPHLPGD